MSTWQLIETAPKDGTYILLLVEGYAIEGYYDASVLNYQDHGWEVISMSSHGCGCCGYNNTEPTHWMPLPEPPQ